MGKPELSDRTTSEDSGWKATAAAWRGCCLEIFSRAEIAIDRCITAIETHGGEIGKDAHHPGARARRHALAAFLETKVAGGHAKATLRKMAAWTELENVRLPLAHGQMTVRHSGVVLRFARHDGGGAKPELSEFSRIEMLSLLCELDRVQQALACQLGQVRADLRRIQARAA